MGSAWKALSDDSRRHILVLLKKNKDMTPSDIARHFDFTLPAISTHLRVLREADLVTEQKHGRNKFYSINQKQTDEVMRFLEDMWGDKMASLKEYVENKEKKRTNKNA